VLTAYSPLGSSGNKEGVVPLLKNETVTAIATEIGRSPAQVAIRWGIQKHITVRSLSLVRARMRVGLGLTHDDVSLPRRAQQVIPKSSNEERLRANFAVFDFELSADQIARLDRLPQHRLINLIPGHFD
jgi:diketogulonate reductase-like aldo/keto reductase